MTANETAVEKIRLLEEPFYRVIAEGKMETPIEDTSNFRAVVYITATGRLVYLSLSHTPKSANQVR